MRPPIRIKHATGEGEVGWLSQRLINENYFEQTTQIEVKHEIQQQRRHREFFCLLWIWKGFWCAHLRQLIQTTHPTGLLLLDVIEPQLNSEVFPLLTLVFLLVSPKQPQLWQAPSTCWRPTPPPRPPSPPSGRTGTSLPSSRKPSAASLKKSLPRPAHQIQSRRQLTTKAANPTSSFPHAARHHHHSLPLLIHSFPLSLSSSLLVLFLLLLLPQPPEVPNGEDSVPFHFG